MAIHRIAGLSRTYRHVNRYRQILTVLVKYGFEDLVNRLHILQYIEQGRQLITRQRREQVESLSTAQRIRLMLQELGPTFIKLGQVLSTRPDLIPPEIADELTALQQHVPPFEFEQVKRIVEEELGRPLNELFSRFDEVSIAAASIGQVHRATLPNGDEVVVKVQRPDIERIVEVDLEILHHLATTAEKHVEGLRVQKPSLIVEEFTRVLEKELDFTVEAAHLERFARQFEHDPTIYVPRVYSDLTTSRVITLEYVDVIPITDRLKLVQQGLDPRLIAERGAELTLKQIFTYGFFHADPHPGNLFALPDNVICLLDFGMMGRLDRASRERFGELVVAVSRRDPPSATHALLHVTEHDDGVDVDTRKLERDVDDFIDVNIVTELGELQFGKLLTELLDLVRRHQLRIPPEMVTMLKAAATVEQVARELDPELNMIARARPYVRRLKVDRIRPRRVVRELIDAGGDLVEFARDIPGNLRDILRQAKRGGLKIGFEHRGLTDFMHSNERIANRVSFAIVVAALIVGSSLIVHARIPPTWKEIPIVGLIGYLAAGVMGFLLLIGIIRHGRL